MKYFMLVWAGLWRKKMRTIYTALSIVVAFFLFGLLQGVSLGTDSMANSVEANRLYTSNKHSLVAGIPLSLANRILSVDGVSNVSHMTFFGGYFQESRQSIPVFATNITELFKVFPEVVVDEEVLDKMTRVKNGALVGENTANKYNWNVGDLVPLNSSIWTNNEGSNVYLFEIVGIVSAENLSGLTSSFGDDFLINYDFFDDSRQFSSGMVHYYFSLIDEPLNADRLTQEIDIMFSNSSNETVTQTENAFAASQIKQVVDLGLVVNSIVGAVLFTLFFLTCNTMIQSVKERSPELAVLKALGFKDMNISLLILCESLLLCVLSALAGLFIASLLFSGLVETLGIGGIPLGVFSLGTTASIALAIVSGVIPILFFRRLKIVDALAGA